MADEPQTTTTTTEQSLLSGGNPPAAQTQEQLDAAALAAKAASGGESAEGKGAAPKEETAEQKTAREAEEAKTAKAKEESDKSEAAKKAEADKDSTKVNPLKAEEIVLPEGITATPEQKTALTELVNKHGIGRAALGDLMKLQGEVAKSGAEASTAAWDKLTGEWVAEVKADAEIGGDKLPPTLKRIGQSIDRYGTPELKQVLDDSKLGNNPQLIRYLAKVTSLLSESQLATNTGPADANDKSDQAVASRLYDKK